MVSPPPLRPPALPCPKPLPQIPPLHGSPDELSLSRAVSMPFCKRKPYTEFLFSSRKKIQIPSNSDPVKLESKPGFGTQQALNKCPFHTHFHASHSLDQLVPIISVSDVSRPSAGLKVPLPLIPILCLSSWLQLPVQASSSWERGVGGKHLWSVLDELLLYI